MLCFFSTISTRSISFPLFYTACDEESFCHLTYFLLHTAHLREILRIDIESTLKV